MRRLFAAGWKAASRTGESKLHTVILDRKGQLAVNLEGNAFTAQELGDLVQTVMKN